MRWLAKRLGAPAVVAAIATGEFVNYALKTDGTLWKWNAGYSDPVLVTDISR